MCAHVDLSLCVTEVMFFQLLINIEMLGSKSFTWWLIGGKVEWWEWMGAWW